MDLHSKYRCPARAGRYEYNSCVPASNMGILLLSLFLSGCCSQIFYVNDPVVLAHVTKKRDFNMGGGVNVGSISSGFSLHGTVAISDRHFLLGSFTRYSGFCEDTYSGFGSAGSYRTVYSGNSLLLGAGRYRRIGGNWFLEGSAGFKYGNNRNTGSAGSVEFRHMKYFIQPGLSFTGKFLQAGLGLRVGLIDYLSGTDNKNGLGPTPGYIIPYADPGMSLSFGAKYIKLGVQSSVTLSEEILMDSALRSVVIGTDPFSFSVFLKLTVPARDKQGGFYE